MRGPGAYCLLGGEEEPPDTLPYPPATAAELAQLGATKPAPAGPPAEAFGPEKDTAVQVPRALK